MSRKDMTKENVMGCENGRELTKVLKRGGLDCWNGTKHNKAKHPDDPTVYVYPNKRLSIGVKKQIIRGLTISGFLSLALIFAIIYMYT